MKTDQVEAVPDWLCVDCVVLNVLAGIADHDNRLSAAILVTIPTQNPHLVQVSYVVQVYWGLVSIDYLRYKQVCET